MSLKSELVNDAYSQLRISGLTVQPSASDMQLALYRMEQMMAELYEQRGLNIGYNFQDMPSLSQQSGISGAYAQTVATNTAIRLIPDFGKEVPPQLMNQAAASLSGAIGRSAANNLRQVQPPYRMPLGNGNTFRWLFWNRYATPVISAPTGPGTHNMIQGETLAYREDFSAWLQGASIVSYQIIVDPLLRLDASSNDSPIINYTITAPVDPGIQQGPWQMVLISITDSHGLTDIRAVNFNVVSPPPVGATV